MSTWENVKKHTRRLSVSSRRSPSLKERAMFLRPTDNDDPIEMQLGKNQLVYNDNEWMLVGEGNTEGTRELAEKNRVLEGENQILKFKLAVLQDMLATTKLDMLQLQANQGK
ncbi:hypothetical protein DFS34DRAFT_653885 [Phlyctochytrium arcticum]|nr:hypothetical protein DFS34DRAFT_653885 [Phlyctochytrium arcticum]